MTSVIHNGDPHARSLARLDAVDVDVDQLVYWPTMRGRALTIKRPP